MLRRFGTALAVAVLVFALLASLAYVAAPTGTPAGNATPGTTDAPNATPGLANATLTGANVSVAILDPTGFDTDDPAYADQVAAARAFGTGLDVGPDAGDRHGTRSARRLASVAPDADLYLAGFTGEAGYGRAMAWAVRADVDVVVVPASFQGKVGDGNSTVENVTERAVAHGVVVVAAAGNTARSHWTGRYDRVTDGALEVANGTARNYLRGGGDVVRAWLTWDREHADEAYALELYRVTPDGPRLVARSVPYEADGDPNARLNVRVEAETHFLVVRGPDRPTGAEISVTTDSHRLQYVSVRGSLVAPATAEGVLSVGAWDAGSGRIATYSASGPTADGRLGVDVLAPATAPNGFEGTSVAAAHAGGVAALVLEARPNATPAIVERVLERATRDVGAPGPGPRSGHGRLVPSRAVDVALANASNATIVSQAASAPPTTSVSPTASAPPTTSVSPTASAPPTTSESLTTSAPQAPVSMPLRPGPSVPPTHALASSSHPTPADGRDSERVEGVRVGRS
jgi:hypothetical protein